ncbi:MULTISPECIES: toxin-antitoxin system YwqK family antitoxin [unclassified Acinetobacter]|uniref:toxin-antitoxin system YwqK family antitoxin n=1 Tax=unclassified Acinetobacter TaxID=196816 RepID=UPI0010231974|nr:MULTISPECIES: hypothetical protein [unclassified Acinetobacter]RZG77505.1 hypothetical protein EXE09_03645 [Acinetobacter sp. WCHAc060025]
MLNEILIMIGVLLVIVISLFLFKKPSGKKIEEYWDSGQLKRKYYYKDGLGCVGKDLFFFRNGKLNKSRNWKNDSLEGVFEIFYSTGQKYIKGSYKFGKYDGKYVVFDKKGKLILECMFKNGQLLNKVEHVDSQIFRTKLQLENNVESSEIREKFQIAKREYAYSKSIEETKDSAKNEAGILSGIKKIGKVATGIQGIQDRSSASNIQNICEKYYQRAFDLTEEKRELLNTHINRFGRYRLDALHNTTGRFLGLLKDMQQENKIKEYKILEGIGLTTSVIEKMEKIDMAASKALANSAAVGTLGAAAAMGTPALVTSAVGALATASTGTAISSLSGVAATNATLAWLGGGSIAAGGGGMAAGATVLTGITAGATAGVGLLAAGLLASTHYSKKLTESKEYQAKIETEVENIQKLWVLLDGIAKRSNELQEVTYQLEDTIIRQLDLLDPLSIDYNTNDEYYTSTFQKVAILIKSMSELAQTPLLDENGNTSAESTTIIENTYSILNTELAHV